MLLMAIVSANLDGKASTAINVGVVGVVIVRSVDLIGFIVKLNNHLNTY